MSATSKLGKVGVTVVSGFLGSGKTTLLRKMVADPLLGPRLAVIVNDVGALGLDPELVSSAGTTPTLRVTEFVSGCICCTLQGDLTNALRSLLRGEGLSRRPEHIVIEPSGIALASELSFAVNALGFDEPIYTDAVVTLVDAANAHRAHREHPNLFEDQLRSADLVLLNKCDLVPDASERQALESFVRSLAPRATLLSCERAAIDLQLLVGRLDLETTSPPRHRDESEHHHAHGESPHQDIGALTLEVPFALERAQLEDFLDAQADRIFRIKGIVDARWEGDDTATPTLVQAVGDRIELDRLAEGSPLQKSARRLIFIGAACAVSEAVAPELRAGLLRCRLLEQP